MTRNNEAASCACATLRPPGAFSGSADFDGHLVSLRESGLFTDVPVTRPHSDVGLVERWLRCAHCTSVWRLVEPDPPFTGAWEHV